MKKIVLFSDGTGNGAATRHGTNVWRLYQALDVQREGQIAFYDDGVGAQQFRLFKVLGGAFGWGLKNNVIELYKTLCRTYKAENKDKIYLFGFSRGAFTVRMLAGMIESCGLYTTYQDEADLRKMARGNFAAYHSKYNRGWLTWPFRRLLRNRPSENGNVSPKIEFVGVWDTVDAYGLPVDELAVVWDWLIYPLRFVDKCLPNNVQRACHALSIDDERHTFHPVLWDERNDSKDRIKQVWFSGVHSDVGGGYPRQELALVTLDWMISEVEDKQSRPGLHFIPEVRKAYMNRSDWHGMQHDSRSGVAAYYRFKPREIQRLCVAVGIEIPKIHRAVLERIQQNIVPYAPTALPADYEVVATRSKESNDETTDRVEKTKSDYEPGDQGKERAKAMKGAQDIVTKRRCLYYAFLAASLILALLLCFLTNLFPELKKDALPDFAAHWIVVLLQNPWWLATLLPAFAVLLYLKIRWFRATQTRAMKAWAKLKAR